MTQPSSNARGSVHPGLRTSSPANVMLFQADCENIGPTMAVATAATRTSPVCSCPDAETDLQKSPDPIARLPACPSIRPSAVSAKRAPNLAKVRTFCVQVPVFSPVALEAVRTAMTRRPTAWTAETEKLPTQRSVFDPEIAGHRTPRNFAKATDTAAIVPV